MVRIRRIKGEVKLKRERLKLKMGKMSSKDIDIRLELIKTLIPIGLDYVNKVLQEEVEQLAGKRYKRDIKNGYDRWGYQGGSVYLNGQKVPISYPRVRDTKNNKEIKLKTYTKLQDRVEMEEVLLRRIINGISCRRYCESIGMIPEAFGMSS